jgi:hypothetical protein
MPYEAKIGTLLISGFGVRVPDGAPLDLFSDIERAALGQTQLDTIRAYIGALSPAAMRLVGAGLKAALDLD